MMSKFKKCEECQELIRWNEDIIATEDGDIYHKDCCTIFPIQYGVMVGEDYKGNSDDGINMACVMLNYGDYVD